LKKTNGGIHVRKLFSFKNLAAVLAVLLVSGSGVAYAANNSTFSQVISTGTLSTDIMDASRVTVASPGVAMSGKSFSFDCQAGGSASTGTLGTVAQRMYVNNPDGADNGWTLTVAATGGATGRWANGGANTFMDFNDPTGSTAGCSDGADADTSVGQLGLDPSTGTLTTDCTSCTSTGVTLGSNASFNQGTTDSITLINAAAGSNDVWRGYLTGVTASQTIPAETPADSYTLNLTLTSTAL
jgi:hypothetical protein